MAYTAPTTRSTGDLITASIYNTDIVDNIVALKEPPTETFQPSSNYTTTSASFVNVNATDLSLDITPKGTEIFIIVNVTVQCSSIANVAFDITKDGVSITGLTAGIGGHRITSTGAPHFYTRIIYITGLTANTTYNFKLQWLTPAGTLTMDNTTNYNQFTAREMS